MSVSSPWTRSPCSASLQFCLHCAIIWDDHLQRIDGYNCNAICSSVPEFFFPPPRISLVQGPCGSASATRFEGHVVTEDRNTWVNLDITCSYLKSNVALWQRGARTRPIKLYLFLASHDQNLCFENLSPCHVGG